MIGKTIEEVINEVPVYDADGEEFTLDDFNEDGAYIIREAIVKHLQSLKVDIGKLVFGETKSISDADYNKAIDDLIMWLQEGLES